MRKLFLLGLLLAVGCGSESGGTWEASPDAGPGDGAIRATPEASTSIDAADVAARQEEASPDAPLTPDAPAPADATVLADVAPSSDAVQPDAPAPTDANPM